MSKTTVRISQAAHEKLREMAKADGLSLTENLSASEAQQRVRFLEEVNRGHARLKQDPQAWAEELAEREIWEGTLMDGLEDEPEWGESI